MEFKYKIDESGDISDIEERLCAATDPKSDEVIKLQRDERGALAVLANKEGWVYLAKICIEMAYLADKDPYFHVHKTDEMKFSEDQAMDGIGLFQIGDELLNEIMAKRTGQR